MRIVFTIFVMLTSFILTSGEEGPPPIFIRPPISDITTSNIPNSTSNETKNISSTVTAKPEQRRDMQIGETPIDVIVNTDRENSVPLVKNTDTLTSAAISTVIAPINEFFYTSTLKSTNLLDLPPPPPPPPPPVFELPSLAGSTDKSTDTKKINMSSAQHLFSTFALNRTVNVLTESVSATEKYIKYFNTTTVYPPLHDSLVLPSTTSSILSALVHITPAFFSEFIENEAIEMSDITTKDVSTATTEKLNLDTVTSTSPSTNFEDFIETTHIAVHNVTDRITLDMVSSLYDSQNKSTVLTSIAESPQNFTTQKQNVSLEPQPITYTQMKTLTTKEMSFTTSKPRVFNEFIENEAIEMSDITTKDVSTATTEKLNIDIMTSTSSSTNFEDFIETTHIAVHNVTDRITLDMVSSLYDSQNKSTVLTSVAESPQNFTTQKQNVSLEPQPITYTQMKTLTTKEMSFTTSKPRVFNEFIENEAIEMSDITTKDVSTATTEKLNFDIMTPISLSTNIEDFIKTTQTAIQNVSEGITFEPVTTLQDSQNHSTVLMFVSNFPQNLTTQKANVSLEPQQISSTQLKTFTTEEISFTTHKPAYEVTTVKANISREEEKTTPNVKQLNVTAYDNKKLMLLDHPPPIILDSRRPPYTDNRKDDLKNHFGTERPLKVTSHVPPPPIVVPLRSVERAGLPRQFSPITTSSILTKFLLKRIPSENDPRYMSVAELAEYTLKGLRQKSKQPSKTVDVQDLFGSVYPAIDLMQTTTKTSSKPLPISNKDELRAQFMKSISDEGIIPSFYNPKTSTGKPTFTMFQKPTIPVKYLHFRDQDIQFAMLDATSSKPVDETKASLDLNFELFNRQKNKTTISENAVSKTQATLKPFFDSNYLLSHLNDFSPQIFRPQPKAYEQIATTAAVSKPITKNVFSDLNYLLSNINELVAPATHFKDHLKTITPTSKILPDTAGFPLSIEPLSERAPVIRPISDPELLRNYTQIDDYMKPFVSRSEPIKQRKTDPPASSTPAPDINELSFSHNFDKLRISPDVVKKYGLDDKFKLGQQRQGQNDTRPLLFHDKQPQTARYIMPTNARTYLDQFEFDSGRSLETSSPVQFSQSDLTVNNPSFSFSRPRDEVYGNVHIQNEQKENGSDIRQNFNKRLLKDNITELVTTRTIVNLDIPLNFQTSFQTDSMTLNSGDKFQTLDSSQPDLQSFNTDRLSYPHQLSVDYVIMQQNMLPSTEPTRQIVNNPQLSLASRLGTGKVVPFQKTEPQIYVGQHEEQENVMVSSIEIFKAPVSRSQKRFMTLTESDVLKKPYQDTHWQASVKWTNDGNHVPVPYSITADNDAHDTVTATTSNNTITASFHPSFTESTTPNNSQRLQVTTQEATRTTPTTVAVTADPNPPPIFDAKILQTFMAMPNMAATTKTPSGGRANINVTGNEGQGQSSKVDQNSKCKGCVFVNDRCLLPERNHCNLYIECVRQGSFVRDFTRECAIGLFFDRNTFLCVEPKNADCPTDQCRKPDTNWYPMNGHCKHYWSCVAREGGRAYARGECCPGIGGFLNGVGCTENLNCTDTCESVIKQEALSGSNCTCDSNTTCNCNRTSEAITGARVCQPMLALVFSGGKIEDTTNTKQTVSQNGVSVTQEGESIFNGGGRLVLWRYANLMFPLVFAIRFRFLSTSPSPRIQTLFSNCDLQGGQEPSIDISIDSLYHEVVFKVNSYQGPAKRFTLIYKPDQWTTVDLIYDGQRVVGSVDKRTRNIIAGAGIETRPQPIGIGSCDSRDGFKGLMDDVYIFEDCIPDDMYGILMSVLK